jgi:subtilisin-like proprotein convertase family protein
MSRGARGRLAVVVLAGSFACGLLAASAQAGGDIWVPTPVNVKIPAGERSAKVTTPIEGSGTINNMFVGVRVTHPQTRDLLLTLRSPTGDLTTLSDRETKGQALGTGTECSGSQTMFAHQSSAELSDGTAPYAATFAPSEPFTDLIGDSPAGDWTLKVKDLKDGNHGRLRCFVISFYITP